MSELLGKRIRSGDKPKTLVQHTQDVVDAADALFGAFHSQTSLGRAWLRFFRIDYRDWSTFHQLLLAACVFHDWGKANDGMQSVLYGSETAQLFRHEHLSVLLLGWSDVDRWVKTKRSDIDWDLVLAAIGSHHLKFSHDDFAAELPGRATRIRYDHKDFQEGLIPLIAKNLGLTGIPTFPGQIYWGFTGEATTFDPSSLRESLKDRLHAVSVISRKIDCARARMLRAVRAALIAADAAGSGLPRTGRPTEWIQDQFGQVPRCTKLACLAGIPVWFVR